MRDYGTGFRCTLALSGLFLLCRAGLVFATEFVGKDGGPMVLIAEGPFPRGSAAGDGDADERPQRSIHLSAFYIDRFEVTNVRYQAFLKATSHRTPEHCCDFSYNVWKGAEFPATLADHPVVNVDWFDSEAYCRWAGKRLPTEAEWEKAARGAEARLYPWGAAWDRLRVNGASYWAGKDFATAEDAKAWWGGDGAEVIEKKGFQGMLTLPVKALEQGATPTGLAHMAGNVWEWVADWYDQAYYATSPDRNPQGPESGEYKVTRGGSWLNHHHLLRTAARDGARPSMRNHGTGFRCAKDP
jgi:formylglycine-generating enzyme required for sulfatase activity